MLIPDVLVGERAAVLAEGSGVLGSAVVRLVAEIVSPASRTTDRVTKPALYARAGIASYWRVELEEGSAVHAYRLGHTYGSVASAAPGELFETDEPFPIEFDPVALEP